MSRWIGERLVVDQARSLMKSPQKYRGIHRFFNRRFNLIKELAEAARCRKLNACLVLSGDDRDRTGNLLVANQAVSEWKWPRWRTSLVAVRSRFARSVTTLIKPVDR
jgi:hypothetical protein